MSMRWSACLPARTCSGAMYSGVPTTLPDRVMSPVVAASATVSFETPKSSTLQSRIDPSASSHRKMLSGLRSRWMTPWACAAATPRIEGSMIATASTNAIGQRLARQQLHHQAGGALVLDDVEDGHDVRVIDAPGGQRLPAEAREHLV